MEQSIKILLGIILFGFIITYVAFAAFPHGPVNITQGPAPKGCQLRGSVSIAEGNLNGGPHDQIQCRQINELKHQAARLGANLIVLESHRTQYYPEYIVSEQRFVPELEAQAMRGSAYYCNYSIYHKSLRSSVAISDVRPDKHL